MLKYKTLMAVFGILCISNAYINANASTDVLIDAKNSAQESGKNIFVNYTADWCLPCQIFKEQVLSDSQVSNLLATDFVMITADYDDNGSSSMFEDFAIACMPTLHILDKEGEVINEMSGTLTASQFYDEISKYALKKIAIPYEPIIENRPISVAATMTNKAPSAPTEYYTLQAGAFSSWDNAVKQKALIDNKISQPIRIIEDKERKLFIINVGRYASIEEIEQVSRRLKDASIDHFVKRRKGIDVLLDKGI